MKEVILLGTSHCIQRGERSPDEFGFLLSSTYEDSSFSALAEEINNSSVYIAESFCTERKIEYQNVDPAPQECRNEGIPTPDDIIYRIRNVYEEEYPEIREWPSNPSQENLPDEVWLDYSESLELSNRAREAIWLERIIVMDQWPLLFICGANHFVPFANLLESSGIRVTELCKHWEPDKNEQ
jgi:hypothetical protein